MNTNSNATTKTALEHLKSWSNDMAEKVNQYLQLKRRRKNDEYIMKEMDLTDPNKLDTIKKYTRKGPFEALQKVTTSKLDLSSIQNTDYTKIMPTKLLKAYLSNHLLPEISQLQTVFDFEAKDVNDDFLTDVKEEFHDSLMVMDKIGEGDNNFSTIPNNFSEKYRNEWSDSSFDSDETTFIPITKKGCRIFFSDILTTAANAFEEYYNENKNNSIDVTLNSDEVPDIPLYFVSLCQKRKRRSPKDWYTTWLTGKDVPDLIINEDGTSGDGAPLNVPPPDSQNWKKNDWEKWEARDENNKIPNIVKYDITEDKKFKFLAYHANIVFFYGGVLYSLGYGLQQDDAFKKNNPILKKIEEIIKKSLPSFNSVDLFGTGVIYSRDDIDLETDAYNYKIIDIGIIDKNMVFNINTLFAKIVDLELQTYITKNTGNGEFGLQYYAISGETNLLYSRLSSTAASRLGLSNYYNCTSFVETIVGSRINCGLLYSDPDKCENNVFSDWGSNKIQKIMEYYIKPETSVKEFTELVKYNPGNIFI